MRAVSSSNAVVKGLGVNTRTSPNANMRAACSIMHGASSLPVRTHASIKSAKPTVARAFWKHAHTELVFPPMTNHSCQQRGRLLHAASAATQPAHSILV